MSEIFSKYITTVLLLIIIVCTLITAFNYTKDFDCYETRCVKYSTDTFSSCKDIGTERVGFLSSEHYYLCDGQKITKSCIDYKQIKTEIKPNLWQVLTYQCSSLGEKG